MYIDFDIDINAEIDNKINDEIDDETLLNRENELKKKLNEIKNEMHSTENEIYKIQKQLKLKKKQQKHIDLIELENISNYLLQNYAYFGDLKLKLISSYDLLKSYNINWYKYVLDNIKIQIKTNQSNMFCNSSNLFDDKFDVSNIKVENIEQPKNDIENKLFPYIEQYLHNYWPITFEMIHCYDYGYSLKIKKNNDGYSPIMIDEKFNVYICVYYLSEGI